MSEKTPALASVPYPVLALLVILGFRMVEALEALQRFSGSFAFVRSLVAAVAVGVLLMGLWMRRRWARWYGIGVSVAGVAWAVVMLVRHGSNPVHLRLFVESLFLGGYLASAYWAHFEEAV